MRILQSRSFEKRVKKLTRQEKKIVDNHVQKLAGDPTIGIEKKGDLRGVFIYKFKMRKIQFLLSYRYLGKDLELIMLGQHENYYRDLKTYLKRK
jgi:mRNA-degrading endonuclease RelE of RelBE toxin-antitoxin system